MNIDLKTFFTNRPPHFKTATWVFEDVICTLYLENILRWLFYTCMYFIKDNRLGMLSGRDLFTKHFSFDFWNLYYCNCIWYVFIAHSACKPLFLVSIWWNGRWKINLCLIKVQNVILGVELSNQLKTSIAYLV